MGERPREWYPETVWRKCVTREGRRGQVPPGGNRELAVLNAGAENLAGGWGRAGFKRQLGLRTRGMGAFI